VLAVGLFLVHVVLYLVAYFWVFGIFPIYWALGIETSTRPYDRRRDLLQAALLLAWIFSGYALFRWVIPAPVNPFLDS
jgi:amino acid transporter